MILPLFSNWTNWLFKITFTNYISLYLNYTLCKLRGGTDTLTELNSIDASNHTFICIYLIYALFTLTGGIKMLLESALCWGH